MRPTLLSNVLDQEYLSARNGQHTPVMLWGAPGVGKSELVHQCAARHGVTVLDLRLSQLEPSDLRGIPFRSEDTVEWAIPSILPNVGRHGDTGILFLDEITSAVPSVSAAAYQLILDRALGEYRVPDGWSIVAAGNRSGDRGITYTMPAPLANRFSHYEVELNLDDWVLWAYKHGIDEKIIAFLRFRPELLFQFDAAENPIAFPSPRSWEFAHRALQKYGDQPALLRGTLGACVGDIAGMELHAFIGSIEKLPDLDALIAGDDVEIPAAIDLQYALATALVGRAVAAAAGAHTDNTLEESRASAHASAQESTTINSILAVASAFPHREIGAMLVTDMARTIGEAVFDAPAFTDWADHSGELLLF